MKPQVKADVMPFIRTEKPKEQASISGETGTFTVKPEGVFYAGFGKDGKQQAERRICSPLRVLGETRSDTQRAWGRLLEWKDNDGTVHRWAMPMDMLAGDGADVTRELLGRGLNIAAGRGRLVLEYIQSCESITRMTCTDKTGWHGGAYVTPDKVYGDSASAYIYQADGGAEITTGQAETLEGWKENIALLAVGNSRLVFSISASFTGQLLLPAGVESGGFHIYGASSTGKTTSELMAACVWAVAERYKRSWRATSNGLEGIASLHNDSILILDEMREASTKDVAETAYMLANGQGKQRANQKGGAKGVKSWREVFLSTGEITLTEMMASEGKRIYAGQEVRIANIPADAGKGMGIFEELHGFATPAALADHLRYAASKYYGVAGAEWLEFITKDTKTLWDTLPGMVKQFADAVTPTGASGQVHRVARRFGLVAVAGELATVAGITGWGKDEATNAAKRCFNDWLDGFGTGNREHVQILDTVRAFIERNGAKFQDIGMVSPIQTPDLVGFYRPNGEGRDYIVLASQLERVCEGFSVKQAIPVLQAAGWMNEAGTDGKAAISMRGLPGMSRTRVYVLNLDGGCENV